MRNFLIGIIFGILAAMLMYFSHEAHRHARDSQTITDTLTITDTIRVVQPVLRDTVVVRYEIARLQVVDTMVVHDSVRVRVPITQKVYADSSYTAWVSGYRPRLDSISIHQRRDVVTITQQPKRWSVGLQGGLGVTPKGVQPYIGIGLSYNLW